MGLGVLVGLYGPSGDGKSFLALDWALSIATGREWFGRSVEHGPVVYVAAEGGRSIRKRVDAWLLANGIDEVPPAFFVLEAVQVRNSDEVQQLAADIMAKGIQPKLIALDTLARCSVGSDENSAQEMGEFIDGLVWLQQTTKATVLVVHHTGKQGDIERGSSALRAAFDVMVLATKDENNVITVNNNKQKDDEEFDDLTLQLQQVQLGTSGSDTSCVLVECDGAGVGHGAIAPHLKRTLCALAACSDGAAGSDEWFKQSKRKERTFHAHRKALVSQGFVKPTGPARYSITDKGRSVVPGAAAA